MIKSKREWSNATFYTVGKLDCFDTNRAIQEGIIREMCLSLLKKNDWMQTSAAIFKECHEVKSDFK